MVKITLASAVLAMASSVAAVAETTPSTWNIINWNAGCLRRGCFYDFNVTSPAYGEIPSFSARCSGDEERANQTFFKPCGVNDAGLGNRGVSAKFVARDDPNGHISKIAISFAYTDLTSGA